MKYMFINMKAKLIFQKESKVIKNGVNPWILSYDLGNYYNSDEVDQFLLKKIPKIPNHDKILIGLNVRYKNLGNKWLWNDYTIPSKVKCLYLFRRFKSGNRRHTNKIYSDLYS